MSAQSITPKERAIAVQRTAASLRSVEQATHSPAYVLGFARDHLNRARSTTSPGLLWESVQAVEALAIKTNRLDTEYP